MPLLTSHPYLNLHLHSGFPATIETEWLGYASSADFRQAITQALRFAEQYQVKGWVADDRRLGAVRPRDIEWIRKEILPALAKIGVQRFALLEAHDPLNRLTIDRMYQQVAQEISFEIRHFTNLELAQAWARGT